MYSLSELLQLVSSRYFVELSLGHLSLQPGQVLTESSTISDLTDTKPIQEMTTETHHHYAW